MRIRYSCLGNKHVFVAEKAEAIVGRPKAGASLDLDRPFPLWSDWAWPWLVIPMDAIVLKALAKRREDRYQSGGELARDVADYLSGRPTRASNKSRRPSWKPWAIAAAALLALIATTAWRVNHRGGTSRYPDTPADIASLVRTQPTVAPAVVTRQPRSLGAYQGR